MHALVPARAFWALWLLLLGAKLVLAAHLPLFGDEAWYWLEGRHLAWAYSDLPGLTAWMIRLGTELLGSDRIGVRLLFVLLSMGIPLFVVATARRWFGDGSGWLAGIATMLLPLMGSLGLLALPDVPLTFAASACLYALACLREKSEWLSLAWLALGLCVGALSHYRFALLLLTGAVVMFVDPRLRGRLRDPRLLAVLLLGALAWLPILYWNLRHGAAGFAFQFSERHPWELHPGGAWFPLVQLLIVSPVLLIVLVLSGVHAGVCWYRRHDGPWAAIVLLAGLPLLVYGVLGLFADRDRVSFHWALQAYLPLLAAIPLRWGVLRPALRYAAMGVAALFTAAIYAYAVVAATPSLRAGLAESRWYPDNFAGWDELARHLRADPTHRTERLRADNFMLGAQLAFAFDAPSLTILDHPLNRKHGRDTQLALWMPPGADTEPGVLVVEDSAVAPRVRLQRYRALCDRLGAMTSPQVVSIDHGRKRFLLLQIAAQPVGGCVLPALAWIDAPQRDAVVASRFVVEGWAFKDGVGVAKVEVTLNGEIVAVGDYGLARPHVAEYWRTSTDPAHPNVGFRAQLDVSAYGPGEHWLGLIVYGRDGSREPWPEQRIRIEP